MSDKHNSISGKKIHNRVFYNTLFIIVVLIILIPFCVALLPSDYILTVQIMAPLVLILLLTTLFSFRKVLCILSDDRLYYFLPKNYGMEFTAISGNKRRVTFQDGWILYSDIQRCEYLPRTRYLPTRVILHGSDFELKISGVGKCFIKQLEAQQRSCTVNYRAPNGGMETPDPQAKQIVRSGLWKDIWDSFENGTLENMLRNYEIIRLESNESLDVIDILVRNNNQEIDFNMDNCSIYMSAPNNAADITVYYEHITDIHILFSVMQDFINCNS